MRELRVKMMARALLGMVMAFAGAACSSDLFHSTNWSTACEEDDCGGGATSGASGGQGGTSSTSTSSSTSAGGSPSASSSSSAGGTGCGGGAGGGIGGACSTCEEVGQVVLNGTPSPSPDTLCPGAAKEAWDAAVACLCLDLCATECAATACMYMQASSECQVCALNKCAGQVQACQNN